MTSDIVDLATESRNNFWVTLKSWVVDLLFFLTTAAFAMAGVRYAYLKIAEVLVGKTRIIIYGKTIIVSTPASPVSLHGVPPHPVARCSPTSVRPVTIDSHRVQACDDVIDSSATSGKSVGDLDLGNT